MLKYTIKLKYASECKYKANWKVHYTLLNNASKTWVDAMGRGGGESQVDLTPGYCHLMLKIQSHQTTLP